MPHTYDTDGPPPRKRKEKKRVNVQWVGGHSLRLTEDEKKRVLDNLAAEDLDMIALLDLLSGEGIKTSLAYDNDNDVYMVTLFRNHADYVDAGYTITARAKTYERCFAALLHALEDLTDFNLLEVTHMRESGLTAF